MAQSFFMFGQKSVHKSTWQKRPLDGWPRAWKAACDKAWQDALIALPLSTRHRRLIKNYEKRKMSVVAFRCSDSEVALSIGQGKSVEKTVVLPFTQPARPLMAAMAAAAPPTQPMDMRDGDQEPGRKRGRDADLDAENGTCGLRVGRGVRALRII